MMKVQAIMIGVAGLALSVGTTVANADILFDNYGPGDTYGGSFYTAGDFLDLSSGPGFVMDAGGDYFLTAITAPIGWGVGANELTLTLYDDLGGAPSTALDSSTETNLPTFFEHPSTTFSFSGNVILEDGATYWVVASTVSDGSTIMAWNYNSTGDVGLNAYREGGGTWSVSNDQPRAAMRVEGTLVPAPGVLAVLGLAGLVGVRRRR